MMTPLRALKETRWLKYPCASGSFGSKYRCIIPRQPAKLCEERPFFVEHWGRRHPTHCLKSRLPQNPPIC